MRLEIPLRIQSVANLREHWAAKARRVSLERAAVALVMRTTAETWEWRDLMAAEVGGHSVVTLTRIAPRALDDDNLRSALKSVRDEVADQLGLPNDRDHRVRWEYGQERGKPKQYAVRVEIRAAELAPREEAPK